MRCVIHLWLVLALVFTPMFAYAGGAKPPLGDDTYPPMNVLVVGDSLAIPLGESLGRRLAGKSGIVFDKLGKCSTGLARPDFFDWEKSLDGLARKQKPDTVVFMLGTNDGQGLTRPGVPTVPYGSANWDREYSARVQKLVDISRIHNQNARIFWVGAPVMGRADLDGSVKKINALIKAQIAKNANAFFVDTRDALADANGQFAKSLTLGGRSVVVRAGDGVHVTAAGSDILAERALHALVKPSPKPVMVADASQGVVASDAQASPQAAREADPVRSPKPLEPEFTSIKPRPGLDRPSATAPRPGPEHRKSDLPDVRRLVSHDFRTLEADAPKPVHVASAAKPLPGAEVQKPAPLAEAPKPAPAAEATKPAPVAEAPKPAPAAPAALIAEAPKPAPVAPVAAKAVTPAPAASAKSPEAAPVRVAEQPAPAVPVTRLAPLDPVSTNTAAVKDKPATFYSVHESSWQVENQAKERVRALEKMGLKAHAVMVNLGPKGVWYRVLLGSFGSVKEAEHYKHNPAPGLSLQNSMILKQES